VISTAVPSDQNTSSKARESFASRSRSTKRSRRSRSPSTPPAPRPGDYGASVDEYGDRDATASSHDHPPDFSTRVSDLEQLDVDIEHPGAPIASPRAAPKSRVRPGAQV
jgi:hypothetical protein